MSKRSNEIQMTEAQFSGLERLLKSHFNDDNLRVSSLTTSNLLQPGENYCSVMTKVDATIARTSISANDEDGREEMLHLVAKSNIPCEKPIIDWPRAFRKELFVYARLLPIYKEIEREALLDRDGDLIDVLPSYVGYVNSSLGYTSEVDDHSILLMENLTSRGYYTVDKRLGLNARQANKALECLARYHALGTSTKRKRPTFFVRAMEFAQINPFDPKARDKTLDPIRRLFRSCPRLAKYSADLESSLEDYNKLKNLRTLDPEEPWVTINHGDFHINNIMFREDESGDIADVKLVDFQTYFYSSPLIDLPLFLCLSLDENAGKQIDNLVNVYHEQFVKTLARIDCDNACFDKCAFDRELKKQAKLVFSRVAIIVLVLNFQADKEDKVSGDLLSHVFESGTSVELENAMIDLIEFYEKRGWFGTD